MAENGKENVDPVTGLTEAEVDALQESWSLLYRKEHRKENAVEFFMILFEKYPPSQDYFEHFKGLPLEKVRTHKKMVGHATSVFYALASFMDYLDDTETLVELVKKQAVNHIKRDIKAEQMKWLIPVVSDLLDKVLGDDCTPIMKSSWTKLLGVLVAVTDACAKEME